MSFKPSKRQQWSSFAMGACITLVLVWFL